jgi:hypothetical protein
MTNDPNLTHSSYIDRGLKSESTQGPRVRTPEASGRRGSSVTQKASCDSLINTRTPEE